MVIRLMNKWMTKFDSYDQFDGICLFEWGDGRERKSGIFRPVSCIYLRCRPEQ